VKIIVTLLVRYVLMANVFVMKENTIILKPRNATIIVILPVLVVNG